MIIAVEGTGEMCLGEERRTVTTGQAVCIPSGTFHQLTNTGDRPLRMIYCYAPAGDVAHWRQELSGTLPRAGIEAPSLPAGAWPQCTEAADFFFRTSVRRATRGSRTVEAGKG
jgi:hypothetical protein